MEREEASRRAAVSNSSGQPERLLWFILWPCQFF